MRKDFGAKNYLFPMPVILIATYCEDGKVDVMNMAWGVMVDNALIEMNLDETHMTSKNLKCNGDFTLALADSKHVVEADYLGIVSANKDPDKFAKTGLKSERSKIVNAPLLVDFPITLECRTKYIIHDEVGFRVIGEIINVSADESVLDEKGKIDVSKIDAIAYDEINHGYYKIGEKVGNAFRDGLKLK